MERVERHTRTRQIPAEAHPFKIGVEGIFCHLVIRQRIQYSLRDAFPGSQIDNMYLTAVNGIAEQQNFKVRSLRILVHAALRQIHTAERFDINRDCSHIYTPTARNGWQIAPPPDSPDDQFRKSSSPSSTASKSALALLCPPRGSPSRIFWMLPRPQATPLLPFTEKAYRLMEAFAYTPL